jgi:DNA-directed RNA polymerase subunit K/omega
MAKNLVNSRTPELNIEKCVAQAGGNRYDMVLMAAARAREIAKATARNPEYVNASVSSLLELQEGK